MLDFIRCLVLTHRQDKETAEVKDTRSGRNCWLIIDKDKD